MLGEYGLGVRKLTEEDKRHPPLVIRDVLDKSDDKDPIVALAEIEHGRWNVERLSYGWCYAPEKDVTKKLSPWLIPWKDLPKAIQNLDLDAVVHLPEKLREAGLEIYEL